METENVIENAQNKFFKKNCDLLVVNDLFEDGAGFKTDTNKVALITKNFVDYLDLMSKEDLAHIILEKLMKLKENNNASSCRYGKHKYYNGTF